MDRNAELQKVFDQATAQLVAGNLAPGSAQLQALLAGGMSSAALEANLGRALVEQGQAGPGLLHFNNAIALDRFNASLRADLALAQSRVEGGAGLPLTHPSEWGFDLASYVRPSESLALASLCLIVFLALRFALPRQKLLAFGAIVLMLIFVGAGLLAQSGSAIAVVVAPQSDLRDEPLGSSQAKQSLKSGTRVRIIRRSGDFSEVERPNSALRGWTETRSLATVAL